MRVEFRHGIPAGCFEWLNENVGSGNWHPLSLKDRPEYDWFYERTVIMAYDPREAAQYVPTITVKDEKMAVAFVLRWA